MSRHAKIRIIARLVPTLDCWLLLCLQINSNCFSNVVLEFDWMERHQYDSLILLNYDWIVIHMMWLDIISFVDV